PGSIVNLQGEKLGQHEGIHRYTIGQRRGTQVAQGNRIYVQSIDPEKNQIVMGPDESLMENRLWARRVRWVHPVDDGTEVTARIRYRHGGARATLHMENKEEIRLDFKEPQRAISPGQAVVFYQGDQVLGGGWIERAGS
ncbi:MAG: aminomethyltransferase beta-barrel domain-containing protein, partial [bacterium]|nr:aminomethyltransferase beta-barrel domain-containing protein [bacterium]